MAWKSGVIVRKSLFFIYWSCQSFLLLGLENIGKTNVFCSFSNYDVGSPAHSLEIMFFLVLLALPMFSAPKARKHWKAQCFLFLVLEMIGFTNVCCFCSGFELLTTKTTVEAQRSHDFPSFPNIPSVGFVTNPHNLSLDISSTTRDAVGPVRAPMKTFVFTCFMKDSELQVSSRGPVI